MGYTTDFRGMVGLSPGLNPEQEEYLHQFAQTRRMKRDAAKAELLSDPVRIAAGLPIGPEGAYFVGAKGDFGQADDNSVVNNNRSPAGQPGLWCQWVPSDDGSALEWDGGEKFYDYVLWMKYIIEHFIKPWGIIANGEIEWRGEEWDDTGTIVVKDNLVTTK